MGTSKGEGKRSLKEMEDALEEDYANLDEEDTFSSSGSIEDHEEDYERKRMKNYTATATIDYYNKKGKKGATAEAAACQVEACTAEMSLAKPYYRRHKVCELHARATVVPLADLQQRFCQQCSRFHDLSEFDETKRSCRRRLAGHNERRRKTTKLPTCTTFNY